MPRALIALAVAFIAVLLLAASLLVWTDRREAELAADPSGEDAGAQAPLAGSGAADRDPASGAARTAAQTADAPATTGAEAELAGAQSAPTPGTAPAPATSATEAPSDEPGADPAETAAAAAGQSGTDPAGAAAPAPSFDIVRVEPTGEALFAGQAAPGTGIEILADNKVIARTTADPEGAFVAIPEAALAAGDHDIEVRASGSTAPASGEAKVAVLVPEQGAGAVEIVTGEAQDAAAGAASTGESETAAATGPSGESAAMAPVPETDAGAPQEAARDPASSGAAEPRIESVGVGPAGGPTFAGRAPPGAEIEIVADGATIARATADADGDFVAVAEAELSPGGHDIEVRVAGTDASAGSPTRIVVLPPATGTDGGTPRFSMLSVGPGGDTSFAGLAAPNSEIEIVMDGKVVARATADAAGAFAASAKIDLEPGAHHAEARLAGTTAPAGSAARVAIRVPEPGGGAVEVAAGEAPMAKADTPIAAAGDQPSPDAGGAPDVVAAADPSSVAPKGPAEAAVPSRGGPIAPADEAASAGDDADLLAGAQPKEQNTPESPPSSEAPAPDGTADGQLAEADTAQNPDAPASPDLAPAPDDASPPPGVPADRGLAAASGGSDAGGEPGEPVVATGGSGETVGQPDGANQDRASASAATAGDAQSGASASSEQADTASRSETDRDGLPSADPQDSGLQSSEPPRDAAEAKPSGQARPTLALTGEASAPVDSPAAAEAGTIRPNLSIMAAETEARRLYVAGEATPGALVRVFANDDLVGEAQATRDGTWLVEAEKEVSVGQVLIRADAVARDPAVPSAQVQLPFIRYADGVVLEPAAAVGSAGDQAAAASATLPAPTYVMIRRGDNLWRISRRNYGRGIRFKTIFAANQDRIRNPDKIYPGQVFVLPKRDASWETATN